MIKSSYLPSRACLQDFMREFVNSIDEDLLDDPQNPVRIVLIGAQRSGKTTASTGLITGLVENFERENFDREDEVFDLEESHCEGDWRKALYVGKEQDRMVYWLDRHHEFVATKEKVDLQKLRFLGGIDIIEHPNDEDLKNASIEIHLQDISTTAAKYDELLEIRKTFKRSSSTNFHSGISQAQIVIKDPEINSREKMKDFMLRQDDVHVYGGAPFFIGV